MKKEWCFMSDIYQNLLDELENQTKTINMHLTDHKAKIKKIIDSLIPLLEFQKNKSFKNNINV